MMDKHKTSGLRFHGAALAALLAGSASLTGCATTPPPSQMAERVAAYQSCSPWGVRLFSEIRPGESGADTVGGFRSVQLWPGDPEWTPPQPLPTSTLEDPLTWITPDSAHTRHLALRNRVGSEMPRASRRILIFEHSNHWTAAEFSLVAWPGRDGLWRVDAVSQINVGSDIPRSGTGTQTLAAGDSARLDALLADPCLRLEPPSTDFSPEVTSSTEARWTLEVEGFGPDFRVGGGHEGFGRAGAIHWLLRHHPEVQ